VEASRINAKSEPLKETDLKALEDIKTELREKYEKHMSPVLADQEIIAGPEEVADG